MGLVESVIAKCPTPDCKGTLYDQVKTGDCGTYDVPKDGLMDARSAEIVNGCTLYCHACGAKATVEADEIPQVRVRLVNIKLGDVNKTTVTEEYVINAIPDSEKGPLAHFKGTRSRPDRETYLMHQKRAGLDSEAPVKRFEYLKDGIRYEGRMWYQFKEKERASRGKV